MPPPSQPKLPPSLCPTPQPGYTRLSWGPGPCETPGAVLAASIVWVICVCNLWGISVNAAQSGSKNLLAHSQFIDNTKVQESFSPPSPPSSSPPSLPLLSFSKKVCEKSMQGKKDRKTRYNKREWERELNKEWAANSHCLGNMFRKQWNCLCST